MINELLFYNIFRPLPVDYDIPPTVYSLLNAYVNFGEETKVKINKLAEEGRDMFFDFDYPLTTNLTKKDFECMILNHFLMRRIGYDTVTAFKIALCVKLNEIMPKYNILFDSIHNWNLFNDGEVISRSISAIINNSGNGSNISDRRYSDTPQNQLSDIRDGSYVTDYNYDTDTSTTQQSGTEARNETETRSNSDKITLYTTFSREVTNVYTLIFKELEPLFYGLA